MTKAKAVLRWTKDCAVSFEAVKERILKHQKLCFMDYDLPIDVQGEGVRTWLRVMIYEVKEGMERPAVFDSKPFSTAERKWKVLNQEL